LNRLTQKSYPDSTTVNYTYDNDSRLTQVSDATGTYSFTCIQISALKPLAKNIGGGLAKGIPILGTGLNVVSTGRDVYLTVEDYEKCTSETDGGEQTQAVD
jgi:YD repeat-containing protein